MLISGYVYDNETGLYYLQSRYYDPELGRFLNHDVVFDYDAGLQGYNLCVYCGNNPVNRIDVSGADSLQIDDDEEELDETAPKGATPGGVNNTASTSANSMSHSNAPQTGGEPTGGNHCGTNTHNYLNFKSNEELTDHYTRHNGDFGNVFNSPQEYLDTANYVIQNGEYVATQNAYVKFYGMNGRANYAFVGLTRDQSHITTFHIKHFSAISFA